MEPNGVISFNNPDLKKWNQRLEDEKEVEESKKEEKEDPNKRFERIVESSQPLFRLKTAIPLNPFPTEILIDSFKVEIIFREFLASSQTESILIKEIRDVIVETNPLFATLKIVVNPEHPNNPFTVGYLKKGEALKARRIIQGLVVVTRNALDLTRVDQTDIMEKLEEIGTPVDSLS
ncbi:hypothetical protein HYS94_04445 [Candidatus Daviesbacteria bacterium]|nr:hypothetical protein [Candidatus Daviesbacteria bacterium]